MTALFRPVGLHELALIWDSGMREFPPRLPHQPIFYPVANFEYPNLLRKDIDVRPGLVRKLKYLKGTLFYRLEDETFSESPYEDVEARAHELRFSGAAPRTRTSFLLQEDKPGLRLYAPINDRFFGREGELAELISKFDDPRGRGVSIAGFGGVGKTELAIRLVSEPKNEWKL